MCVAVSVSCGEVDVSGNSRKMRRALQREGGLWKKVLCVYTHGKLEILKLLGAFVIL